ncbi:hypothetical protein Q3G72_011127 [Acer saccharum]|nr:hypothetical protein Q3G72_011127 [Acer saccharum]
MKPLPLFMGYLKKHRFGTLYKVSSLAATITNPSLLSLQSLHKENRVAESEEDATHTVTMQESEEPKPNRPKARYGFRCGGGVDLVVAVWVWWWWLCGFGGRFGGFGGLDLVVDSADWRWWRCGFGGIGGVGLVKMR